MRDFNFFEPFISKEKKSEARGVPAKTLAVLLVLVLAAVPAYNFFQLYTLRSEAQALETRLLNDPNYIKLAEVEQKEADLVQYRVQLSNLSRADEAILASEQINERLLFVISGTLPRDLALNAMSINQGTIQVQGVAASKPAIAEMEYNLRQTGEFANIFVPSISENDGLFNFALTFQIGEVTTDETD
jgi:type IV pilus assembly protein PilN